MNITRRGKLMKRVVLKIQETLKFQRGMIIKVPDNMTENELNKILDIAQAKAYAPSDITFIIEDLEAGIEIATTPDESTDSPWDTEIEIEDFNYVD
jgi:hypothetical protein